MSKELKGRQYLKDHEIAELLNSLVYTAVRYEGAQQLRSRLSTVLGDYITSRPADGLVEALRERLEAVEQLSVCYRLGKRATGKLLDELDRTKQALAHHSPKK
jgi:hypothetical protein